MTEPLSNFTLDQVPRMQQPVPLRPAVLNGEINGTPVILLVIESVNGTFSFTMPLDFLADNFMPLLNSALMQGGRPSMLPGKIVPATLDDLRKMPQNPINQNGQGGPG